LIPFFGSKVGLAAVGTALVAALGPRLVHTPAQLVGYCLLLPLVANWTIGLDRSLGWVDSHRSRSTAGAVLRAELDALGATDSLVTRGHVDAALLLGARLLPDGDEMLRTEPTARWLLHESTPTAAAEYVRVAPKQYQEKLRLCVPRLLFVVSERAGTGK